MSHSESIERIKRVLRAFFAARTMEVNADALRMWIDAFADMTPEGIEYAIRRFNRECTDYPTPAAVRRYAGAIGLTDEQRAAVAWRSVRSAVLKYGAYYGIEFDDPIIHAAIRGVGGWTHLCNTPHDQMQWKQRAFVQEYVSVARTGIGECKPLAGLLEQSPRASVAAGLLPHTGFKALTHAESDIAVELPKLTMERVL